MAELIGGKYTPSHSIGVAGRTEAYVAVDATGTKVAVATAKARSQADADRFAGRAQIASTLQHPDVAKIVDWGTDGDTFYAAQEWVEGKDLASALQERGRPFSSAVVAEMGAQVAAALSAAHGRNLTHGDLRPSEIVQIGGQDVKVAGLGLPASADAIVLPQSAPPEAAYYMSPEQARGEGASPASDIYGLGAVLYHLATGRVPFDAATAMEVASMQVSSPLEPARRVNPEVSASLESVIAKAMAKNPAQRYGSAEELRAELGRIATGATIQMAAVADTQIPVAPAPEKGKGGLWAGILIIVAALLLGAWYFLGQGDIEVPDLSGMTIDEAQLALEDAGLMLGDVSYRENFSSDVDEGTVLSQDPSAGDKARDGADVTIVLAGGELAAVPDVVGVGESEAVVAIRDAGFELGTTERQFNTDVEAGLVIEQVPGAGTEAPLGSPITITVSKGKEIVSVPAVVGMSETDATTAIEDAGLSVRVDQAESSTVAEGNVISQSPEAGVSVDASAQITIVVSTGAGAPAQVRVPGVVGQTEDDAITEIEAVGLVPDINRVSDLVNAGKVIAQGPVAGTMVDAGSTVSIDVGE